SKKVGKILKNAYFMRFLGAIFFDISFQEEPVSNLKCQIMRKTRGKNNTIFRFSLQKKLH
ncbi:TPA: hypothetical protein ACGOS7_002172, partial [Streptococcus suis]